MRKGNIMKYFKIILLLCYLSSLQAERKYIYIPVKINNVETKLILDTGSSFSVLSERFCKNSGIKLSDSLKSGSLFQKKTESCSIEILDVKTKGHFYTNDQLDLIPEEIAGVLSFNDLKNNILYLNIDDGKAEIVTSLPKDLSQWKKWSITRHNAMINIMIDGERILLDTGAPNLGIYLRKKVIKSLNLKFGKSLWYNGFDVYRGGTIEKQSWLPKLKISDFYLRDIPINHNFINGNIH